MSDNTANTVLHPQTCGCSACVGYDPDTVIILDANVDGTGGTISGKTVFTLDQVVANMNRTSYVGSTIPGPQWNYGEDFMGQNKSGDAKIIQYGFYETRSEMFQVPYVFTNATGGLSGRSEYFGFQTFSAEQRAAAEKAIALWDDLIDVKFVKTSAPNADITFGNLTNAPNTQAYAYLPYNYGGNSAGLQGDIWISLSAASNLQLGNGFYGLATLIHEFGHAIGLQHPGGYNAAPGLSITYGANAEYYQDSRMYSQMSYFNAEFTGGGHIDWNRLNWTYGQTPLLHDIATIQAMYGADPTTRTGDTVYGFNSTADRDVYDFSINTMPVISIYDAGGIDTLDFSGWNTKSIIDLNAGAFSDGGGSGVVSLDVLKARGLLPASYTEEQYLALRTRYNAVDGMLHQNISIAYGTIIENATGGGGNDIIIGNAVDNVLIGNAGDDKIEGRLGNDTLNGGLGADMMLGGAGNDLYFVDNTGDSVVELAGEGTDTVSSSISYTLGDNVENLILTDSAANGTGNGLDNVITGNAGSNRLNGGAGDDRLIGGDGVDYLTGGAGKDVFVGEINSSKVSSKDGPISLDVVLDFQRGSDKIDLSGIDANTLLSGDQAFTLVNGSNAKNAGEIAIQHFGSMDAAEAALGMEIDGFDGKSPFGGPVSVLFGNVDGGAHDFAMVFVNTPQLTVSDFIM
jgi:serralysin